MKGKTITLSHTFQPIKKYNGAWMLEDHGIKISMEFINKYVCNYGKHQGWVRLPHDVFNKIVTGELKPH